MTESIKRPDFSEDNGIAAVDLLGFFRSYAIWIISVCLIAGAAAYTYSLTLPNQWLATCVIQLGQLDDKPPVPIDTPARTLVRLQSLDFQDQLAKKMGWPLDAHISRDTNLLRNTLAGQSQPNTDLVMISARGYSPELARQVVTGARDAIIALDAQWFSPYLDRAQKRIAVIDSETRSAEQLMHGKEDKFADNTASIRKPDAGQSVVSGLLGTMLEFDMRRQEIDTRKFLDDLQQQRAIVQRQLDPVYSYSTRPVTDVSVAGSPVSPHRSVIAAFGAALGLVFAIVFALFWHVRKRGRIA